MHSNVQEYEVTTITALANFATSTAADCAALSKLTDTVQELTAELKAAREKIDDLKQQLSNAKRGKRGGGKENKNPGKKYYCFECGYSSDHPSKLCPRKKEGHKDEAHCMDTMGGSTNKLSEFLAYMKRNANSRNNQ